MKDLQLLCAQVRQTAYDIHLYHGHGHLHGLLINFGSYKFEMRKFAWSQDAARRKSKPTFLLSAVSAFFALLSRQIFSSRQDFLGHKKAQEPQKEFLFEPFEPLCGLHSLVSFGLRLRRAVFFAANAERPDSAFLFLSLRVYSPADLEPR